MIASPRLSARYTQLLIGAAVLTFLGWLYISTFATDSSVSRHIPLWRGSGRPPGQTTPSSSSSWSSSPSGDRQEDHGDRQEDHTIDVLRAQAQQEYRNLLARETHEVYAAAKAYERRRGRRPPPGFDAWFRFAKQHGAVVVEDFFDRIYHDLGPFWAINPLVIRQQANGFVHRISVRGGNVTKRTDLPEGRVWLDLWADLVSTVSEHLPDLDMAINEMDESRMIVPWETINGFIDTESKLRRVVPANEVTSKFTGTVVSETDEEVPPYDPEWRSLGPYWDIAVVGCSPDSPARSAYTPATDYTPPPPLPTTYPEHSYHGYVQNWTLAKSICDNPSIQQLHGTFVEPISISNTAKLMPLFGGSKLPVNNEILLPPAMYWTTDPFYSGGASHGDPWDTKRNALIWRGAASGGRNREENWTRFQRHRFVSMMNSTSVTHAESSSSSSSPPPNFALPDSNLYNLTSTSTSTSTSPTALGPWLSNFADAAFVHLLCFPDPTPPHCAYTDPYYSVAQPMPMAQQYAHKYLPDIDGNSFSGRYRGFLGSTSLPLKATIYDEWHDSRLVPWVHFVPLDNSFVDIYGVLAYFLGFGEEQAGRDAVAREIAQEGKAWAERVLRREDMQIYVFRLLLEYARVCDDARETLGWVSDKERRIVGSEKKA